MPEQLFSVRVGGDYACFTRPEFKVEKVSYPMITPSAARGLLEAIFWKPEVRWEIRQVWLLKPVRQVSILRNEIASVQSRQPILVEDQRQQRHSLVLRDVEYVIKAALVRNQAAESPLQKYIEQAQRRIEHGQCHHTPYLGTREFAAWFEPTTGHEEPVEVDDALGRMVFDIAYREDGARQEMSFHRQGREGRRVASGYAETLFFDARLNRGVMDVPAAMYDELYRLEGLHVERAG